MLPEPDAAAGGNADWETASVANSTQGSTNKPKKVQSQEQKAKNKLRDCTTISVEGSVWLRKLKDLKEEDLTEIGLCLGYWLYTALTPTIPDPAPRTVLTTDSYID